MGLNDKLLTVLRMKQEQIKEPEYQQKFTYHNISSNSSNL